MFRKAVTLLFLLSPAVSYAGLFDSTPELKCGNDNAVTAAKEWIYNEALGRLQQDYIKEPSTLSPRLNTSNNSGLFLFNSVM